MVENSLIQRWTTDHDETVVVTVRVESESPLSDSVLELMGDISQLLHHYNRPAATAVAPVQNPPTEQLQEAVRRLRQQIRRVEADNDGHPTPAA